MPRLMLRPLEGTLVNEAHRDGRGPADGVRPAEGRALGDLRVGLTPPFTVDGDYHYQSFGTPRARAQARHRQRPGRSRPTPRRWPSPFIPRERWRTSRSWPPKGEKVVRLPRGGRLQQGARPQGEAFGRGPLVHGHHHGMSLVASPTPCSTSRCPGGSTPSRWSGPPNCSPGARPPRRRRSSNRRSPSPIDVGVEDGTCDRPPR